MIKEFFKDCMLFESEEKFHWLLGGIAWAAIADMIIKLFSI